MTRVLLFGAGASRYSGDIMPELPPLGNQLFHELARCFRRTWGALPADADAMFRDNPDDFEIGMGHLWEHYSPIVPELMQQMALYFIQFRPRRRGATLYCSLAAEIRKRGATERLLLSTLNYDCLLEYSISSESVAVNYGDFPARDGAITVWKVHGSCNFLPVGVQATRAVQFTRDVIFGTAMRPAGDPNEVARFCLGDNALPPVMCLFMEGKPTQVSPGSLAAMQQAWRSAVMTAEKVAIVGVRPNPADAHVWDALAQTRARLLFIGDQKRFSEWAANHRGNQRRDSLEI